MNADVPSTDCDSRYDHLAQVFSRVFAETHSVATALEVLDVHRAREALARPVLDLPKQVLAAAAAVVHVPASRLLRPGRHRDLCAARWIAAWLLHRRRWTTVKIGRFLGLDHSTVLHGLRRVAASHELLLLARSAESLLESRNHHLVPAGSTIRTSFEPATTVAFVP
jgi:chromosomal replication initiation ATPase DnaA